MAQGKLRIGLGTETVLMALAHAKYLHKHGPGNSDGRLAGHLERGVQAVKQAFTLCPSWDVVIPALLDHPLEVGFGRSWLPVQARMPGRAMQSPLLGRACGRPAGPPARAGLFQLPAQALPLGVRTSTYDYCQSWRHSHTL